MKFNSKLNFILIFAAFVCIAVLLIQLFSDSANPPASQVDKQIQKTVSSSDFVTQTKKSSLPSTANTNDYQYCQKMVSDERNSAYDWARNEQEKWHTFLQQGFSLDEITLAIEYFTNSNFAVSFRYEQLIANSSFVQSNRQTNEKIKQEYPDFSPSSFPGYFEIKVPSPELENFKQLTPTKKSQLLDENKPNVDDVAFFISQPEMADSDILMMISALDDPKALVGHQNRQQNGEIVSLLDYAIVASRPVIVETLLKQGVEPTTDQYLGSSMEWALSTLNGSLNKPSRSSAVKIVSMLQSIGAKARFSVKTDMQIQGHFPRRFYDFDAQKITSLLQENNLDLTQIESREVLRVDTQSPLITLLKRQQADYLSERFNIIELEAHVQKCEATLDKINKMWTPENPETVVQKIMDEFPDSPQQIMQMLANIDPFLVDYYRHQQGLFHFKQKYVNDVDRLFRPLMKGQILDVIDDFSGLELTDVNKNWIFLQILMYDFAFYDELVNSHLYVDNIPFYAYRKKMLHAESLETLLESGANFFEPDKNNKTLVFYAVHHRNIKSLEFLLEQRVPFNFDELGQDPLHLLLNVDGNRFQPNTVHEIADILKQYQPVIDQFHLSRMALIKLKYLRVYEQLVAQYPQLSVNDNTPLPRVYLQGLYF